MSHQKLIPDPIVARERYRVHPRTIKRWDKTPGLNFPPSIRIRDRNYRSVEALDAWDKENSRRAAAKREGKLQEGA
jgi:hypothetical protein